MRAQRAGCHGPGAGSAWRDRGHAWKGGIRLWKTEISPESAECWTRVCNRTPGLEVDSAHACRAPRPGRGHQVPFLLDDISLVE